MDEILWVDEWALSTVFYAKMLTKKEAGEGGGFEKIKSKHSQQDKINLKSKKIKLSIFNVAFNYHYLFM